MATLKWKKLSDAIGNQLVDSVAKLSDSDLRHLRRVAKEATTTNVWWVTYELRNTLAEVAENELQCRRDHKKRKAKTQ